MRVKNNKSVVAQINHTFFEKSQTFIYHYIANLQRFQPICLTWMIANLEQFPLQETDIYLLGRKKLTPGWLYYGIIRYLIGRDLLMEKILKEREVKLIHAHFGPAGVYAIQSKRALKIPLITSFYGYDISVYSRLKKLSKQYRILFEVGERFLVEGNYMRSRLIELGCPSEKIEIQRIAIPVEQICFRRRSPKRTGEKIVLSFCGRFVEKKGIIYALKALKIVRNKYPNFEFRVIGDGPLKPEIENYIKEHKMTECVRLLGFLNYRNYLQELQQTDIYLQPSVTSADGDSEGGAPTTILEAQAAGIPVVSTFHADIPNVVVPGKSALLAEERNCEELATHIIFLLENQELWEEMGETGRRFVENYHNIKNEILALEDKYNTLILEQ
ncbi:MAG: glycosyltransferase [Candidatus Sumerlaeia bacterium]|nr:glycosyltransferase [Candidatus Sumerlaeia bacterium]